MKYNENRTPDCQYGLLLQGIVLDGEAVPTRQGPSACTLMQQALRYDLANGFPLITERDMSSFWRKPIGELCAFINGARTIEELEFFGCDWWGPWATQEKTARRGLKVGDLGPGSYGPAFHNFPVWGDESRLGFNQFQHLVQQIKELPDLRTHFVSPWIPQYQGRGAGKNPRTTIAPCHGWVHVRVLNERLHLHMFQRSGDVPVGVPANMIQYAALMLMLEHLTGIRAGTYYHTISDAHIYANQYAESVEMVRRAPRALPTVHLNGAGLAVKDIHDFRSEHFDLFDYDPHPALRIPVAA